MDLSVKLFFVFFVRTPWVSTRGVLFFILKVELIVIFFLNLVFTLV